MPALGETSCGKVVLCASTCDPDRIAALGACVAQRGLIFLEAPVSGTSEQVRRGEGVGLIGGEREVAARIEPILRALFASYFHVGRIGDGGRAKLAINLILGLNRLALAEGLVFAARLGLDPAAFLSIARASAAYSQVMDTKGAKMVARASPPKAVCDRPSRMLISFSTRPARCVSSCRSSRSMPTCSKPACAPATATATTASSSKRSSGDAFV